MAISTRLLGKNLGNATAEDLATAYDKGLTLIEIAKQLRCSATTVRNKLIRAGVELRARGPIPR